MVIQRPKKFHSERFVKSLGSMPFRRGTHHASYQSIFHADKSFSDLPVVVSLEVHTSPPQQKIMVDIMKELWSPYLDLDIEVNDETPLPLLDTLRRRILVKVKYTAPENVANKKETAKGTNMDGESSDEEEQEEAMRKGHIIPELGCMGVYTRSYHFKSFDQPEAKLPTHIFSLSEKKLLSTHQREGSALFQHNKVSKLAV